jgi:membrane-bound serine protease (ClpP class)
MGFLLPAILFILMLTSASADAQNVPGKILVIPVHDDIETGLSFFIQRQLRRAERENFSAIVLEIKSNGGLVTAAQEIKDALLRSKVTTIAYIKGRALSAAALIAISCHRIYMEAGSELGAATPIMLAGSGVQAAEAKFVSAFKAEFRAAAEARKRPTAIAEAMVDKDHDTIEGLSKRGEIVTMTSEVALKHGYCDQIVSSLSSIQRIMSLENATVEYAEPTSGEWIARWLTNPNISILLFTIGFWCLIIEFFIAGFGILGWLGLTCLALFFGGHLFAYLAGLETLILFAAGIVLLMLEAFVIPGFGLTGISGILCVCFSIIMVFGGVYTAMHAMAQMLVYSAVIMLILYKWGPKFKLLDKFVLKEQLTTAQGCVAISPNEFNHLLNLEGVAVSPCRPAGIVKIGDERYDVVSDGDFIEKGARVIVRKVEGNNIVVRQITAE